MTTIVAGRPEPSEHAAYYAKYTNLVPEEDLLATLSANLGETVSLLGGIPDSRAEERYAPGKWSIREVVQHVVDSERVFGFRAFWFARSAGTELPGFEQDDFIRAGAGNASLSELRDEFEHVRRGHIALFEALAPEAWRRSGKASGNLFTVRALAAILSGHARHHAAVLRDKYGVSR